MNKSDDVNDHITIEQCHEDQGEREESSLNKLSVEEPKLNTKIELHKESIHHLYSSVETNVILENVSEENRKSSSRKEKLRALLEKPQIPKIEIHNINSIQKFPVQGNSNSKSELSLMSLSKNIYSETDLDHSKTLIIRELNLKNGHNKESSGDKTSKVISQLQSCTLVEDKKINEPFQDTQDLTQFTEFDLTGGSKSFVNFDRSNFTIPKVTHRTGRNTKNSEDLFEKEENDQSHPQKSSRRKISRNFEPDINLEEDSEAICTGRVISSSRRHYSKTRTEDFELSKGTARNVTDSSGFEEDKFQTETETESGINFIDRAVNWDRYYLETQSYTFVFKNECKKFKIFTSII